MSKKTEKTKAPRDEESSEKRSGKPLNKGVVAAGIFAVVAAACIALAIFFATGGVENESIQSPGSGDEDTETTEVAEGRAEAPEGDEGRTEAVYAAADILSDVYVDADGEDEYLELLQQMDEGDFSSVPDSVSEDVRLSDVFAEDDATKATALQSLISVSAMVKDSREIGAEEDITPDLEDSELAEHVLYDAEVGIAYVPISVFSSDFSFFTMEMIYTEGEDGEGKWVLSPYTLMEGVSIYTLAQQQLLQSEGTPDEDVSAEDVEGLLEDSDSSGNE